MKSIVFILVFFITLGCVNAQIKSVEIKGSSVLIVGVNNQKKVVYILISLIFYYLEMNNSLDTTRPKL